MSYPPRVEAALKDLTGHGLKLRNCAPPLHRLMWRYGLNIPPPHMAGFLSNFISTSLVAVPGSALALWLYQFIRAAESTPPILIPSLVSGISAGLAVACYFWYTAIEHDLPRWSSISSETET